MCSRPAQLSQGSFVTIPALANPAITYGPPRITPEGDTLFVVNHTAGTIDVLTRTGASWTAAGSVALPYPLAANATIGVPTTAGPQRRMMLANNDAMIHELAIDASSATELHAFAAQELGGNSVTSIDVAPSLTPDGLHVLFVALDGVYPAVYYGSRPSVAAPFAAAAPIAAAGNVSDPFITGDCGHLYFSVVGSVVYVKQ